MKLHTIKQYDVLAKTLLFGNPAFRSELYLLDTGDVSIGYNFNLQSDFELGLVLEALRFDPYGEKLSGEAFKAEQYYIKLLRSTFKQNDISDIVTLQAVVNNILSIRHDDPRYQAMPNFHRVKQFSIPDRSKLSAICYTILEQYEKVVDNWITVFDYKMLRNNSHLLSRNSMERAVLVSLAARNIIGLDTQGSPLNLPLAEAIINDDRAEAWFQIRYGTFSADSMPDNVAVKRRYLESEMFGLYDDGVQSYNISREICTPLYSMYNRHKDQILHHERQFKYLIDEVNSEFGLSNTVHQVKDLEQSFSIAYNSIRNTQYIETPAARLMNSIEKDMDSFINSWSHQQDIDYEIALAI